MRQDSFTLNSESDSSVKNNSVWNFHFKHLPQKATQSIMSLVLKAKNCISVVTSGNKVQKPEKHYNTPLPNSASPSEWVFKRLVAKSYYLIHGHFALKSSVFILACTVFLESQEHLKSSSSNYALEAGSLPLLSPKNEGVKIDFLSLKMFWALQELLIIVVYKCQISGILTSNSRGGKLVHITVRVCFLEKISYR